MPERNLNLGLKSREGQPAAWRLFSICWWLAMTVAGYAYVEISEPLYRHLSPWYFWLLATVAPFLVSQSAIFWLMLRLLFPRRKTSGWVILMSVLILAVLLSIMAINVFRGIPALRT